MKLNLQDFNIRRSNPIIKGSYSFPNNIERYIVKAQGLIGLDISGGDKIKIINTEGGQICEVVVFDDEGINNQAIISQKINGDAKFIKYLLTNSSDKNLLLKKLKKKKINIKQTKSSIFFNHDSPFKETFDFIAQDNAFIIFAAPGDDMQVDKQNAPTDIEIIIDRKNKIQNKLESFLPEPLASPKNEFLIKDSSAITYEIKKGDFIQIIDLYGRQCSDFMAFDSNALQKGKESAIDTTVSRAINVGSYPMPGLHSKYYDKNMDTLIEVVQDTIGRHDTFGTACTRKMYEDAGYFGHINCSDNFNYVLDSYGVEKRLGWSAINLFFNTSVDANNVIFSDMPWSRPGDYVLFQAQKDLLCVSSACPSDIEPANDWNPTDIYVRVYNEKNRFSKSIGYRKNADSDFMLTKETGFHPRTSKLTKDMMDSSGFWIPNKYNNYGTIS